MVKKENDSEKVDMHPKKNLFNSNRIVVTDSHVRYKIVHVQRVAELYIRRFFHL